LLLDNNYEKSCPVVRNRAASYFQKSDLTERKGNNLYEKKIWLYAIIIPVVLIILVATGLIVALPTSSISLNEKRQHRVKLPEFVLVKGGTFLNTKSNYYGKNITISNFYIGRYKVTQNKWIKVMGSNPSEFKGDNLPVETVSWYDCIEYCNKKSIKEDLKPYYKIDKNKKDPNNENNIDDIKWTVMINAGADGYRFRVKRSGNMLQAEVR